MTKIDHIKYWLRSSEHDLATAKSMYSTEHYDWCLFIGHLVLEKILKAHFAKDNDGFPPKTHDLILLANKINVKFDEEQLRLLERTNDYNMEARYPDEKLNFYRVCTKDYATINFQNIEEMYLWLKSQLK